MADSFAHYVKFARSLALTSTIVLQACGGAGESGESQDGTDPPAPSGNAAGPRMVEAAPVAAASPAPTPSLPDVAPDAGAGDADGGFVSGPLPPPELPASFARA